jgi:arginyl-tRNA synthetase
VLRNAQDLGLKVNLSDFKAELLVHERERELLGGLAEYPRVVASAAELRQPHRIARYIEELATLYHGFYNDCRVLPMGEEPISDIHRTRVILCEATRQVINNGLSMLGVSAPERM